MAFQSLELLRSGGRAGPGRLAAEPLRSHFVESGRFVSIADEGHIEFFLNYLLVHRFEPLVGRSRTSEVSLTEGIAFFGSQILSFS